MHIGKRIIAMLLCVLMIAGMIPTVTAEAAEPAKAPQAGSITLSIEKRTIGKGDLLSQVQIPLQEGDTPWDAVKREMDARGIAYVASENSAMGSVYISEIEGDGEFDHGSGSGWMYTINDVFPDLGISNPSVAIASGDSLRLRYTTSLGEDLKAPLYQLLSKTVEEIRLDLILNSYTEASQTAMEEALDAADNILMDQQYNSAASDKELVVSQALGTVLTAQAGLVPMSGEPSSAAVPDDWENDLWLQYDFKELKVDETTDLYPRRVPQIVSDNVANDVFRPNFNFDIVSGSSVSLSTADSTEKCVVTAVEPGVTLVKVTYDACDYKGTHYGASSSVNTAYVVYAVTDGQDTGITITPNTEIQPGLGLTSYDTIYFSQGSTTDYVFAPTVTNADTVEVTCNGKVIPESKGTYTLPLENRSNVIGVKAVNASGTKYFYQVIDARKIEIKVVNLTAPGQEPLVGDKIHVSFRGITIPVYKLATIYNPTIPAFAKGTFVEYQQKDLSDAAFIGKGGQYNLATQNSFTAELTKAGTLTFTDGRIYCSWWGSPLGSDKGVYGQGDPNLSAPILERYFSLMPDFSVTVTQGTDDQNAARSVDRMISAIGKVTLKSEQAIVDARKAYEALTPAQQALVTQLKTLEKAEKALEVMKADKVEAQKVDDLIMALGKLGPESREKAAAARKAYEALTDSQKKLVTKLRTLEQMERQLKAVDDFDQAVLDLGTVTLEKEKAIQDARKAYNRLNDAQKALTTQLPALEKAEAELSRLKAADVDARILAIGTVTKQSKDAILDARQAYNSLTDAEKAMVTKLDVLEAAEKALYQLFADEVTIQVSLFDQGKFSLMPREITVTSDLSDTFGYTDNITDGVSVLDALIAVHQALYGDSFTAAAKDQYLTVAKGEITLVTGKEGSDFRFLVNAMKPHNGVAEPDLNGYLEYTALTADASRLLGGDDVLFYFNRDPNGLDDYAAFWKDGQRLTELTLFTGDSVNLDLLTYNPEYGGLKPDIYWDAPSDLLPICTVEADGTLKPIEGLEVGEYESALTLKFDAPGTYYLAAGSFLSPWFNSYMIPGLLKVTVTAPATTDVTLSMEQDNVYSIYPQVVTISETLSNQYGYVDTVVGQASALDALIAAHELLFAEDFNTETCRTLLDVSDSGFITTMLGEVTSDVSFAVNGFPPHSDVVDPTYGSYLGYSLNQAPLAKDDVIQFFFYNPDGYWGEIYTNFLKEQEHVTQLTLTQNVRYVLNVQGYSFVYEGMSPDLRWKDVSDIQVALLVKDGDMAGKLVPMEGAVTDENGNFTVSFPQTGTYYLAVTSDPDNLTFIIPQICKVTVEPANVPASLEDLIHETQKFLLDTVETAEVGSVGGEWTILGLARSGAEVPHDYYARYYRNLEAYVESYIQDGERLSRAKSTDNSRVIAALTAICKDPSNVAGHNLIQGLSDMKFLTKQGNNGPIWALIALDTLGYQVPDNKDPEQQVTREALLRYILDAQYEDGGWGLYADPTAASSADMTGMALQALAPYYHTNKEVHAAVTRALTRLSAIQNSNGGFGGFDAASSESSVQVIVALTALGIDPHNDQRFIKNGKSVVDDLLSFAVEGGGFRHVHSGQRDLMASEQALYGLAAYARFVNGENALYNMTDAEIHIGPCHYTWSIRVLPTEETEGQLLGTCSCGSTVTKALPAGSVRGENLTQDALQQIASKLVFDEETADRLLAGEAMVFQACLQAVPESQLTAQELDAFRKAADGDTSAGYATVILQYHVGQDAPQALDLEDLHLETELSLSVDDLREEGRTFRMLMLTGDQAAAAEAEYDAQTGTLTFTAELNKLLNLVYADAEVPEPSETEPEPSETEPSETEPEPSETQPQPENPTTGDMSPVGLYLSLVTLSLIAMAGALIFRKKNLVR